MLDDLRQSLAATDAERFRRAAHSLKSNGSTFGALELAAVARDLELSGAAQVSGRGPQALAAVEAEYARVGRRAEGPVQWLTCAAAPRGSWWPTTTRSTGCC